MLLSNLLADLPDHLPEELVTALLEATEVRIERIVSHGHASPEDFWYDQEQNEWVMVLRGAARLRIKDEEQPVEMKSGDFVNIPAHTKHRVEWTTGDVHFLTISRAYGYFGWSSRNPLTLRRIRSFVSATHECRCGQPSLPRKLKPSRPDFSLPVGEYFS